MGDVFGTLFRITTWGESHGDAVGVVVEGCPPRLALSETDIQAELDRRRPGQSELTTQRREKDRCEIHSGVFEGLSLGTPIAIAVYNTDARGKDYEHLRTAFRPSHADYTYQAKYGIRNWRGGGRASARETIGRVAAGAIAKKILREHFGVEIVGYVVAIEDLQVEVDSNTVVQADVDASLVRCPDGSMAEAMAARIKAARKDGDSLGGIIECVARGVPTGWGSPVFDKLEADLGKAVLSVPACKAFEVGSGFAGTRQRGSAHNDAFYADDAGRVRTRTNRSGGIQGGISNGENVLLRAGFKPTSTILLPQESVDVSGKKVTLEGKGRHDPCVLPRAVPVVEAMVALVLVDHALRHRAQCGE